MLFILTIVPFTLFAQKTLTKTITIAFLDTGFCPHLTIIPKTVNARIEESLNVTANENFSCPSTSTEEILKNPRFHGQNVLNEFLRNINILNDLKIITIIVFDGQGKYKKEYFLNALKLLKLKNVDIVISAAGLIDQKVEISSLSGIWFLSSGNVGPLVSKATKLYPQELVAKYKMKNAFLIGDYFDDKTILFDQSQLYQNDTHYFFPSGNLTFKGTSRAVSIASSRALNLCINEINQMHRCLSQHKKILFDPILKREFYSF